MEPKKEKLLQQTYDTYMGIMLHDTPLTELEKVTVQDLMGYGTTIDERVFTQDGLASIVMAQRELGDKMQISYEKKLVHKKVSANEDTVVWVDEINVFLRGEEVASTIPVRVSSVFYYLGDQWKLVHWHASTAVQTENDTWHLNEWKKKQEELQKLVDEKTAELKQKNRELEIEAALERVRSCSMGMQRGEDLKLVVKELYDQLRLLGFQWGAAAITIMDETTGDIDWWMEGFEDGYELPEKYHVPYFDHPGHKQQIESWRSGIKYAVIEIAGQAKKDYDSYYFFKTDFLRAPEESRNLMMSQESVMFSMAFMKYGALAWSPSRLDGEQAGILQRFAKVFEQTYTRFLDLQKAEAQAREAQIEAALEKVRSRSLAMHRSDELKEVVVVVFEKLKEQGLSFDVAGIQLYTEGSKDIVQWVAAPGLVSEPVLANLPFVESAFESSEIIRDVWAAKEMGKSFMNKKYSFEEKNKFFEYAHRNNDLITIPENARTFQLQAPGYTQSLVAGKHSALWVDSYSGQTITDEMFDTLVRFARVFEQAYVRFLDLQKAEAQAREAQIESALERIRGKALAMHSSQDLADTIGVFYRELQTFSLTPRRCGVGLLSKETRVGEILTWNTTEQGEGLELVGRITMEGHPVLENVYTGWLNQTDYYPVLRGNEIKEYYRIIRPMMAFPDYPHDAVQYGYFFFFNEGGVYAWTEKEMNEDEIQIYRRFSSVLSLTYSRYKDLKEAEARAAEAVKQAALDRVRAEISSMRTAEDLQRITPLMWHELTTLGVPFFRCGVFIIKEQEQLVHAYLSTPDGKSLAVLHLPFEGGGTTYNTVEHWRKQIVYTEHWDKERFKAWTQSMVEQGQITVEKDYQAGQAPPESLCLQFIPFTQGMLYIGSADPLDEGQIELAHALANAFAVAYSRYEDFIKLETAKQQIEKALIDIKQTQAQLVQSEKMASLGELTAGIAHEIQNPLNFVNNFSEVSKELIGELKDELAVGSIHLAVEIADDIQQNLEKIHHHGERASSIVKGMLQHSRRSSGEKEPTDINALIDEYVRLAYHGLKAKDKTFNATYVTNFDPDLPPVEIIPQDMGRVLLNLINNAFYAVHEKNKVGKEGYKPEVIVSTEVMGKNVVVSVSDNGNGIPESIRDKIFQPFFTTKPTGEGTGLGLSLSYDIVKAHGGELQVETKEGEGSEFIIQLPYHTGKG